MIELLARHASNLPGDSSEMTEAYRQIYELVGMKYGIEAVDRHQGRARRRNGEKDVLTCMRRTRDVSQ